ncbi:hypothetical protein EDD37DRAFT_408107 [Exophiala viscosa]|uniref:uncharacterized protein n=1 Tax=Exophiala viscosa TaxID=2486360 RepID=UPI002194873B|nr:hypothetical protein EDD37DRAFT_408107 [Exophiala viscosa]
MKICQWRKLKSEALFLILRVRISWTLGGHRLLSVTTSFGIKKCVTSCFISRFGLSCTPWCSALNFPGSAKSAQRIKKAT